MTPAFTSSNAKGPRAIAGLFACVGLIAASLPAQAYWQCEIERSFTCNDAGACTKEAAGGTVVIADDKGVYQRCRGACIEGFVIQRRSFFGTTYKDVQGDLPGLVAMRSRSGEYTESTVSLSGKVTAFAFGTCAWRE